MLLRVTCGGVLIGTAQFDLPAGLAHATLVRTGDYSRVSAAARALGRQFALTRFWSPLDGDFADAAAAKWEGGRLALEDASGRELGVSNVLVLEGPLASADGSLVRVVADFRPDLARARAFRRTIDRGGSGRTRPAA
ncbi:MAG: hypothetical protein K0S86_212 [Geminicoccaceae bacterium]|nr:hypothetical protein [Geminicoccaceae bacterium]